MSECSGADCTHEDHRKQVLVVADEAGPVDWEKLSALEAEIEKVVGDRLPMMPPPLPVVSTNRKARRRLAAIRRRR